jgi:hypothetical protein
MKHKIYKSHQFFTPHSNPSKYNTRKFTPKENKKGTTHGAFFVGNSSRVLFPSYLRIT